MNASDDWLTVGTLVAPQGLRGELRVKPASEFPERFTKPGRRWIQKRTEKPREIKLLSGRKLPGKSIYVLRFSEIHNRTEATALVGQNLLVPANSRPKLADDEYHFLDLIGLEARLDQEGAAIGHVIDLKNAGHDLLEIKLLDGRNVLVPFVHAIVPKVELKENWLLITPPPGLLEL